MTPELSFGSSVFKRESRSIDEVDEKLQRDGWQRTASILGGMVRYYEQSGINITAVGGPLGTTIGPSGPIRGAIFGDNAVTVGRSSIGKGSKGKGNRDVTRQNRSQHI